MTLLNFLCIIVPTESFVNTLNVRENYHILLDHNPISFHLAPSDLYGILINTTISKNRFSLASFLTSQVTRSFSIPIPFAFCILIEAFPLHNLCHVQKGARNNFRIFSIYLYQFNLFHYKHLFSSITS